jgi:hypothetical protein
MKMFSILPNLIYQREIQWSLAKAAFTSKHFWVLVCNGMLSLAAADRNTEIWKLKHDVIRAVNELIEDINSCHEQIAEHAVELIHQKYLSSPLNIIFYLKMLHIITFRLFPPNDIDFNYFALDTLGLGIRSYIIRF